MDKEKSSIEKLMPVNHNVDMDIARYKLAWLYVAGINDKSMMDYLKSVKKHNNDRGHPVEILIVENGAKLRVYVYIFPDEETHKRYLDECDYELVSFDAQ